jgi:hypothetical protein
MQVTRNGDKSTELGSLPRSNLQLFIHGSSHCTRKYLKRRALPFGATSARPVQQSSTSNWFGPEERLFCRTFIRLSQQNQKDSLTNSCSRRKILRTSQWKLDTGAVHLTGDDFERV